MNPIETAVSPLKVEAVARAEKECRAMVQRMTETLEGAGWDLNVVAPYPNSRTMDRKAYLQAKARRNSFHAITRSIKPTLRPGEPYIVELFPAAVERFVESCKADAAAQYDAFVAKLSRKIGECLDATLSGNHVWGYSVLTVEKADGSVERWQTQQIVNCSSLGKLFNQWPSRKLK